MAEVYFSLDIEADGPIPGPNSMLSFGLAAFTIDGGGLVSDAHGAEAKMGFNLNPLPGASPDKHTMDWWRGHPEAYAAATCDRQDPKKAMSLAASWIHLVCSKLGRKPVCVAYPGSYDFMWWHWYAITFLVEDPFGFQCFDIKTAAAITLGVDFKQATKSNFPSSWFDPNVAHTHRAVDDAVEQGHLFVRLMKTARDKRELAGGG